jgi:hypothetical protein
MCHFAGFPILLVMLIGGGHNGMVDASNEEYQHYDGFVFVITLRA